MGKPQRFLFDVSFDRHDPPAPQGANEAPEPRFALAELERARAESHAQGRSEALAEAAQATEARLADTLEILTRAIERLAEERARIEGEVERVAVTLVRTVLHRAVPALAAKDPLAELEAFVTRTLGEAFDEPRIVLRVGDALFEPVKLRLPVLSQGAGYSGKLVLLADPALGAGDGRIEWADGGAERDIGRLLTELDRILARSLPAPAPEQLREPEEIPHD
jgi:flagellar assembly protein FliH